ncbi:hypothetical protein F0562_023320 [Nyssa sinensis]|uniref:Uncharacterized protein n=1 Tax=Nyssa sinensis TaxID=561372 RepID=A0A5J5BHT1_9ASTE|nr:hypothetical protein F0562_023320 [Nyssa sinensis]
MLGRVRPSSTSPECLERQPSKITKDDSLSIYETTLMKLKQGSRRDLSPQPEDSVKPEISCTASILPYEEATTIEADCSSTSLSPSSSDCQSMGTLKEQGNMNMSILRLFSRYKSSRHALSSPNEEAMTVENDCSSASTTPSHLDFPLTNNAKQQHEHVCCSSVS